MKKKWLYILVILIFIIVGYKILFGMGVIKIFNTFLNEYCNYVKNDVEHRAELIEDILGGVCAGAVTFISLAITILNENKKDREYWLKERKRTKEERLLSVRPFLNLEIVSVSVIREDKVNITKDYVIAGVGNCYQYANVKISNNGFGKCKGITLDGHKCSISQLGIDEEQEIKIYFVKLCKDINIIDALPIIFCYQDIFGNTYSQEFVSDLNCKERVIEIEIREPLLKKEEK